VTRQVENELKIPAANLLITATHTHSVPGQTSAAYVQKIVESVRLAKARLVPARVGYGAGGSYLNVNRNIIDPKTKQWWEGPNYEGPSDKTVGVVKFETLTGDPIAVYYNYAMHGVTVGQLTRSVRMRQARFRNISKIPRRQSSRSVVVGAAGDQTRSTTSKLTTCENTHQRLRHACIDISNAMPPAAKASTRATPSGEAHEPAEANDRIDGPISARSPSRMRGMQRMESNVKFTEAKRRLAAPVASASMPDGRFAGPTKKAPVEIRLGC
jgi:hypothetical protein